MSDEPTTLPATLADFDPFACTDEQAANYEQWLRDERRRDERPILKLTETK